MVRRTCFSAVKASCGCLKKVKRDIKRARKHKKRLAGHNLQGVFLFINVLGRRHFRSQSDRPIQDLFVLGDVVEQMLLQHRR